MPTNALFELPLLLAALASFFLASIVFRRRWSPGAPALLVMLLAGGFWAGTYALELRMPTLDTKLLAAKLQYLGIAPLVPAWFVFTVQFTRQDRRIATTRNGRLVLSIIPALTVILVWTNELHNLIWTAATIEASTPIAALVLVLVHGSAFWLLIAYDYVLVAVGTLWLLGVAVRSSGLYRKQAIALLLGILPVWLANALYVMQWGPGAWLDLTPFAMTITSIVYAWSLLHLRLLDIVPLARSEIFAFIEDAIVVVDLDNCIADVNPAGQQLAPDPEQTLVGKPLAALLGTQAELVTSAALLRHNALGDIRLVCGGAERSFELRASPLRDVDQRLEGYLYVLHDVTERKHAEEALQQLAQSLEQRVLARTRELQDAEQRYRSLFEEAPAMYVIAQLEQGRLTIVDCNALFVRTMGCEREQLLGIPLADLLTPGPQEWSETGLETGARQQWGVGHDEGEECAVVTKDGRVLEALLRVHYERDESGSPSGVRAMLIDIGERKRMEQQLRETSSQLRALGQHLESIREEEQSRIAREIHDELGQTLTVLKLNVGWLSRHVPDGDGVLRKLSAMNDLLDLSLNTVQRIAAELRPAILDNLGLIAAMEWLTRTYEERTGIACTFVHSGEDAMLLDKKLATALFRISQEALTNAARHAKARSVEICLDVSQEEILLEITDDGIGITRTQVDDPRSFGLVGMRERLYPWNGRLAVVAAQGQGTSISVVIPLRLAEGDYDPYIDRGRSQDNARGLDPDPE